MKKNYLLIAIAWSMYVLAWFLPVHKDMAVFPKDLPGWRALLVSMSSLFSYLGGERVASFRVDIFLCAVSGATNLLMIGSALAINSRRWRALGVLFWMALTALIINANWCLNENWWISAKVHFFTSTPPPPSESGLRIGYFVWCLSFLVLAAGIHQVLQRIGDEREDR